MGGGGGAGKQRIQQSNISTVVSADWVDCTTRTRPVRWLILESWIRISRASSQGRRGKTYGYLTVAAGATYASKAPTRLDSARLSSAQPIPPRRRLHGRAFSPLATCMAPRNVLQRGENAPPPFCNAALALSLPTNSLVLEDTTLLPHNARLVSCCVGKLVGSPAHHCTSWWLCLACQWTGKKTRRSIRFLLPAVLGR